MVSSNAQLLPLCHYCSVCTEWMAAAHCLSAPAPSYGDACMPAADDPTGCLGNAFEVQQSNVCPCVIYY